MNNSSAKEGIDSCLVELDKIHHIIEGIGQTSHPIPYLTKYSIIKACGTLEYCFKTIIADVSIEGQSTQLRNFVDNMFRKSSMNPNKDNIHRSLNYFDENWNSKFKIEIDGLEHKDRVLDSLKSLNDARNTFAHGGNPTTTFDDVRIYFNDTIEVLKIIDQIVHEG